MTGPKAWMIPLLISCSALAGAAPARAQGAEPPPVFHPVELIPPSRSAQDYFGTAADLSADGGTALITLPCLGGTDCGVAHVFVRRGQGWFLEATITPPRLATNDFVSSVALSAAGDLALIGVTNFNCSPGVACGAAFLFARTSEGWREIQRLNPSTSEAYTYFGATVALSPDGATALVANIQEDCGAASNCGAVYVFERSGGIWTERQKLFPSEHLVSNYFGGGMALSEDGGTLWVRGDVGGGAAPGAIYVFTRSGGAWILETKILPPSFLLEFGSSFALSGDGRTAVVSSATASFLDFPTLHFYVRDATGWRVQATAQGGHGQVALSTDGNLALAGSRLFRRNGESWQEITKLSVPPFASGFRPSGALSGDGSVVLIGVPTAECGAGRPSCGRVFVFASALEPAAVPTLGEWGLILLTLLLAASGAATLAGRRRAGGLTPAR